MSKVGMPGGRYFELSLGTTVNVGLVDGRVGTLTLEAITPTKAARWVRTSRGARLRCTKATKIIMYANLMRQGRWKPGGRICIDHGFVVKGRYALAAIVSSGITQEMQVLRIHDLKSSHPQLY